ncbi:MAG TPA: FAD-dependent oxidoreductase, partial [Polyangiaceae bacterium]|nr:FAD-dependent oxidoreductase [Polyangiaceae bacterium]
MSKVEVVVAGNGMVSHRFCERLVEYDVARVHRVTVLGEEPRPAYDRVHLTDYFARGSAEALGIGTVDWYDRSGIDLRIATRVVAVDRARGLVKTARDECLAYDVLVLATGSSPFVPQVPGVELAGVFVYRTIEDLDG